MGEIITALLYLLAPYIINEGMSTKSLNLKLKAEALAKKLYNMIADNNELKDRLVEAYSQKNSGLMNQLLNQAGYSAQVQALKNEISKASKAYQQKKAAYTKQNAELSNAYNKANNAYAEANTGIINNLKAEASLKDVENLVNGGNDNNVQEIQQQNKEF